MRRNRDLVRTEVPPRRLASNLPCFALSPLAPCGGGMSDMGLFDYVAMVEETPVDTHIVEYRRPR